MTISLQTITHIPIDLCNRDKIWLTYSIVPIHLRQEDEACFLMIDKLERKVKKVE